MKNYLRNIVFVVLGFLLYLGWVNGGETAYAKFVATGINQFTTKFSSLEKVKYKHFKEENTTKLFFKYPDRGNNISMEYCLPIVILLAWHISLFFDKRVRPKFAFKLLGFNFVFVYFLQIIFPLLLFNISQSKVKSMSLFVGLQIFGFLIFFLILKDSLIIKYKFSQQGNN